MDKLAFFAVHSPDSIFIKGEDLSRTYRDCDHYVNKLAAYYSRTVSAQRVALMIPETHDVFCALWALLRLGKDVYLLNYLYRKRTDQILKDFNLDTVIRTLPIYDECFNLMPLTDSKIASSSIRIFTSGTMGDPKCVVHSFHAFCLSAASVCMAVGFNRDHSWALQLPLFHVAGLGVVFRVLDQGATLVSSNHNDIGFTHISCVTKQLRDLIKNPPKFKLNCVLCGGSTFSSELLNQALAANLPVWMSYGLSECASTVALGPYEPSEDSNVVSSGKVLPHVQAKVQKSCLTLQSESLCLGYEYKDGTFESLKDKTLLTQDMAMFDDLCLLYIQGRIDNAITLQGETFHLEALERSVLELSFINDAIFVGITIQEKECLCVFVSSDESLASLKVIISDKIRNEFSNLCVPYTLLEMPKSLKSLKHSRKELQEIARQALL